MIRERFALQTKRQVGKPKKKTPQPIKLTLYHFTTRYTVSHIQNILWWLHSTRTHNKCDGKKLRKKCKHSDRKWPNFNSIQNSSRMFSLIESQLVPMFTCISIIFISFTRARAAAAIFAKQMIRTSFIVQQRNHQKTAHTHTHSSQHRANNLIHAHISRTRIVHMQTQQQPAPSAKIHTF